MLELAILCLNDFLRCTYRFTEMTIEIPALYHHSDEKFSFLRQQEQLRKITVLTKSTSHVSHFLSFLHATSEIETVRELELFHRSSFFGALSDESTHRPLLRKLIKQGVKVVVFFQTRYSDKFYRAFIPC